MMIAPGRINDQPHSLPEPHSAQKEGMMVPSMFPTEVCEFQIPIIRPRLVRREGGGREGGGGGEGGREGGEREGGREGGRRG